MMTKLQETIEGIRLRAAAKGLAISNGRRICRTVMALYANGVPIEMSLDYAEAAGIITPSEKTDAWEYILASENPLQPTPITERNCRLI